VSFSVTVITIADGVYPALYTSA